MSVPVDVCDPVSGITLKAPFVISTTCPVNLLGRDLISQLQLMIRTTAEGMWSVDRMVNLWVREGEMCSKFWSLDIPEKQPPPFSEPITMIYGKALSYLQPEAQLHNQTDLHVTMHVERTGGFCKSDPHGTSSYAEKFAKLKDPQMIVIMHLYVCGQTAVYTAGSLSAEAAALFKVSGSVPHVSIAKPLKKRWQDLGCDVKHWSSLPYRPKGEVDFNDQFQVWRIPLKTWLLTHPATHLTDQSS